MDRKVFTHIIANVILVIVVLSVATVSFVGAATNVFKSNDSAPIYRGSGDKQVTFLINVYWGTEYIDGMLSILEKYNAKASFFVGGCWVAQYPDVLQKIVSGGHEIGNHGYYHKEHSKLDYNKNVEEIKTCGKLVFEYCGINPTLFAPPGGDFSNETLRAAKDCGYRTIMWSRDTIDWRDKDSELVYTRATKGTDSGELILMHPTEHTLSAFERIIKYYIENDFAITTASQNIGELCTSTNNTPAG